MGRVAVVIPTYNERANVETTAGRIRLCRARCHWLIVDDNSSDGTGELADKLAAEDSHVHVLHRTQKAGLGAAYIAGFRWALAEGYDVLVEMDADGSHQPEELPLLLDALKSADLGRSAPAWWLEARCATGRSHVSCCRAAATPMPG